MLRLARPLRILAAAFTAVALTSGPVSTISADGAPAFTSVTIVLTAPDQAGLDRLASAQGLSHAQRMADLAPLLPSVRTHREVVDRLHADGFSVTSETAWTITARAPVAIADSTFGTPAQPPGLAASAFPRVPAPLAGLAAAVLPTAGPALFTPLDSCRLGCRTGTDFRNAYTAPHVPPATGRDVNGPLTVATLQFAGWNPQDLSDYAASIHRTTDPVATGQYLQIPVGEPGNKVPVASRSERGADEEVDLDQETILATDPSADQRAYFNPNNSAAGYAEDIGQVVSDVTQGPDAADGGDPKIVALSTSWGSCEDEFDFAFAGETIKAVENVLKSLTAAGVTVFAASGDSGVYDCGNSPTSTKIAVDYPASSPEVIGVGGTRLRPTGPRAPNTGANWVDKGWRCASPEICQGTKPKDTGGSGGGESSVFGMPEYQAATLGDRQFTTTTGKKGRFGTQRNRLVPDIADDGDPGTGLGVLTSDPSDVKSCAPHHAPTCHPKTFAIGGTSLSSPEAAALFTDLLGAHGATAGVGDIHDALYSAYAVHHGAFRDVTAGVNGSQADVDRRAAKGSAAELPVTAQPGYDTLTGLGAPLWPRIAPFIFAPQPQDAAGTIRLSSPHSPTRPTAAVVGWGPAPASRGQLAAAGATVSVTQEGKNVVIYRARSAASTGSHRFLAHHGGSYRLSVTERDLAGQVSAVFTTVLVVPHDDRAFTLHGSWTRVSGPHDYAGSVITTDDRGSYATITETGRRYVLEVRTGPAYGELAIDHAGATIGTYDLYSPHAGHRRIAFFGTATTEDRARSFAFRYTGLKNPASTGTTVDLDALLARR